MFALKWANLACENRSISGCRFSLPRGDRQAGKNVLSQAGAKSAKNQLSSETLHCHANILHKYGLCQHLTPKLK